MNTRTATIKAGIAVFSIATMAVLAPHVQAAEISADADEIREAVATAPPQYPGGFAPTSADGGSWAPGGVGAYNWLYVKGNGLHVSDASVAYFPGTNVATSNACADQFEIAYYENGRRVTRTAGHKCAPGRVTHKFNINRNLDADTPFCGRARVGNAWGNYACINIVP